MKKYLILIALILAVLSCKKSQNNSKSFSGIYIETSPTANATQLNFISSDQVTITGSQIVNQSNLAANTFKYQVANNIITFISTSSSPDTIAYLVQPSGSSGFSLNPCTCLCPCANSQTLFFTRK
jgi:hypothetical protein